MKQMFAVLVLVLVVSCSSSGATSSASASATTATATAPTGSTIAATTTKPGPKPKPSAIVDTASAEPAYCSTIALGASSAGPFSITKVDAKPDEGCDITVEATADIADRLGFDGTILDADGTVLVRRHLHVEKLKKGEKQKVFVGSDDPAAKRVELRAK